MSASWVTSISSSELRVRSTRHCGSVTSYLRRVGRTRAITASRARIRIAGSECGNGFRSRRAARSGSVSPKVMPQPLRNFATITFAALITQQARSGLPRAHRDC